jgi:H+/Cl- antiporter ClcA
VIVGQALQMSKERQRLLLGAGAAAGLAAGFNAPIAGVFFALEVVLGTTFATSAVSVVLLSAVVAALIAQIGLGGQPPFTLPSYEVRSPLELPLYLGLGLFASLVSIAYTQSIQRAQQFFDGQIRGMGWMSRVPMLLRPALGGLCVGAIALQFPQILGIGYETCRSDAAGCAVFVAVTVESAGTQVGSNSNQPGQWASGWVIRACYVLGCISRCCLWQVDGDRAAALAR